MRALRVSLLLASLFPLTGCFGALAGLDDFHIAGGGDFCWNLTGFIPHVADPVHAIPAQAVGIRVIDATNTIAAVAVYDPLPSVNVMGTLAGPLSSTASYRVQIFADRNTNRMIDPYPTDHVWDLDYASMATTGCFTFAHGPPFDMSGVVSGRPDDPNRVAAVININHRVALFDGRVLVMTLHDMAAGTDVAFYRYVIHPTGDPPIPLADIIQTDTEYSLDAYLDMNENGVKDPGEPTFSDMEVAMDLTADLQFTLDLMPP